MNDKSADPLDSDWPDEILLRICHLLPPSDLARVSCVCKSWRRVAQDTDLWSSIDFRKDRIEPNAMWALTKQHFGEHVRSIYFKLDLKDGNLIWTSPSMNFLRILGKECPQLEELSFDMICLNNVGIRHLVLPPKLKKLSLINTSIQCSWSEQLRFPETKKQFKQLTHLDLTGSRRVDHRDIEAISYAQPPLVCLKISNIPALIMSCVKAIITNLTTLQRFELSNVHCALDWSLMGENLKDLTYLNLSSCFVGDKEFELIATHLTGLRTLLVADCRLTSKSLRAACSMKNLSLLDVTRTKLALGKKNIEELRKSLPDCVVVTDSPRSGVSWKTLTI